MRSIRRIGAATVTKSTQDMEAAKEVLRFLFSEENVATYARVTR